MRNGRFFQHILPVLCAGSGFIAANEDIFAGDPATDVVNMGKHDRMTFFIIKNAGATGTATITVESCDDVTPTTKVAIPFKYWTCTSAGVWSDMQSATASGFSTTAGADQLYAIEVGASALNGNDERVRMQMTEVVDSPCDGGVMGILSGGRYVHEVEATPLT